MEVRTPNSIVCRNPFHFLGHFKMRTVLIAWLDSESRNPFHFLGHFKRCY